MSVTPSENNGFEEPGSGKQGKIKKWQIAIIIVLGLALVGVSVWQTWVKPAISKPISATLDLVPIVSTSDLPTATSEPSPTPTESIATATPTKAPVCGVDQIWNVMLVGIDERSTDYYYGLADVIRIARINFADMTVNMVALPRDMLVTFPEGLFATENPIKINQGYFFGTIGMTNSGDFNSGANSLAQVIQYNFGITVDHYMVVNMTAVENFIESIGGVDVDLPVSVFDEERPNFGSFPAGQQHLDGEKALNLMRIRANYGDDFRIGNQSIVIKSILQRFLIVENIAKVPDLIQDFFSTFLTDLSIEQLTNTAVCFLTNFKLEDYHSTQVPKELLVEGWEFIPSNYGSSFIYRWDQNTVDWIHQNLEAQSQ